MAEWLGQAVGQLPGWLILPVLLIVLVIAAEVTLAQTGDSLMDVWRQKNGKK